MSDSKTFSVKRDGKPGIRVTGFPADTHRAFINLKIGDSATDGKFQVILYMDEACALQIALENAINHRGGGDPGRAEMWSAMLEHHHNLLVKRCGYKRASALYRRA